MSKSGFFFLVFEAEKKTEALMDDGTMEVIIKRAKGW
jgi:hypothetical protein